MRGILLVGGAGTRMAPLTTVVSKHLLPVYDKPMVYYPLSVLLEAGVHEVLIIATPRSRPQYQELLGSGVKFGARFRYAEQPEPHGISDAFTIASTFVGTDRVALILGDNVFHGAAVQTALKKAAAGTGAHAFAYEMENTDQLGVATFDKRGAVTAIEEKPAATASRWALTGLYVFDADVCEAARNQRVSPRGELEITDTLRHYLKKGALTVHQLGARTKWFDAGTPDALLDASKFVESQRRRGGDVGLLERAAVRGGLTRA